MEFFKGTTAIPFMKHRFIFVTLSLLIIAASLYTWVARGNDKYGVDFLGGTDVVLKFPDKVTASDLRRELNAAGFGNATVQAFEGELHEFSIRVKSNSDAQTAKQIIAAVEKLADGKVEVLKEDFVGPVIGDQIRSDGLKSIAIALVGILIYISVRFEWRFAIGAILALIHDMIITCGIFVISGKEISAAVLAAILTILGYSLNDTIIVYDRIRENFARALSGKKDKDGVNKKMSFTEMVDLSINQTLSRTVLTSVTTLFVCLSLWLLGGGAVSDLAFVLLVGIIVGTYSSIFIASVTIVALDRDFGKAKSKEKSPKVEQKAASAS